MTASSKKKLNNSNAARQRQQQQRQQQQQQHQQQQQQQIEEQQQQQNLQNQHLSNQQPTQNQQQRRAHQRQQRQLQQHQQLQQLQQQQQRQEEQEEHQQQEQISHHQNQQMVNTGTPNGVDISCYREYTNNIQHLRCRIDVLDMSAQPDGEFKYILIYQDDASKFIFLKPMQGKDPEHVSNNLIDIFCQLGATLIVSAKCCEFAQQVMREMRMQWPGCFVVVGRSPSANELLHYQRCADNVKEALMKYIDEKRSERWSRGLRFVQWNLNSGEEGHNNRQSNGVMSERALLGVSTLLDCNIFQNLETEEGLVNALISHKNS